MSSINLDDAFISDIDDIKDGENNNISHKTFPLWSHITYKNPIHPGVPVCKKCNYAFSIKSAMSVFDPYYKVPDRHQIKEMVIQEFNQRRSNIYKDLQKIPGKVSFTADMSQYVNCKFAISKILYKFNLADKALALTTDNESAMLVCRRILTEEFEQDLNNLSFSHYCCSAHILNLAVKQGMEIID
ncbi:hypothetical protein RhiirC2_797769 [Rhizophagus irregularis]|uniref:Zinc finger bed domain-containing protein ricesleeper 2-like n=1 Tax=Rhizophagus irregularis TaxID=588596 RepID=A0A2N1M7J4_9GLOM|nr:hypothetical protein RhiirC2_797769 [Rhizophagus irregularis]